MLIKHHITVCGVDMVDMHAQYAMTGVVNGCHARAAVWAYLIGKSPTLMHKQCVVCLFRMAQACTCVQYTFRKQTPNIDEQRAK